MKLQIHWPLTGRTNFWVSLTAAILSSCGLFLASSTYGDETNDAINHAKTLSHAFRAAAESTIPSVVTIITKSKPDPDRIRRFRIDNIPFEFRLPDDYSSRSVGSGVIIDESGLILTNSHVVHEANEIWVRLHNGHEVQVKDVHADEESDLAVLRMESDFDLAIGILGDSDTLEIGDWVIAIGSPFELDATVSAGIISGKSRGLSRIRRGKLIQTDAAINPGNSGGPLVTLDGKIIGISTAIASNSGGYQGIGFAIPSNRVKWVVQELLTHGKVRRAYLGIRIKSLDAEYIRDNDLNFTISRGVYVEKVLPETPAAVGGLETGDIIFTFAGTPVYDAGDLQDAVEQLPFESTQTLTVMRDGQQKKLDVVLKPLPQQQDDSRSESSDSESPEESP